MFLSIHPDNPERRKINQVVECLKSGGVIIYPTDTVYALGCDISKPKAIARVCQIKGIKPEKANLSFICNDLSHISEYTLNLPTPAYKVMRKALPGPFTFILKANNNVPKLLKTKKKSVGIRIPNNEIARSIVRELNHPILSTSLHHDDEVLEYMTDPNEIFQQYGKLVDLVIDGGYGDNQASSIISFENDNLEVIREGKGDINEFI